jgi:uncharacterized protein YgbK (DUF1537 family)
MIVVIADDITGAAELGGIALRYGLSVCLSDDAMPANADVLVVYTNTRSMKESDAVNVMKDLTAKAKQLQPTVFYKKTDSVLRGHVLAEMNAQMQTLNVDKALLVPVNPSLERIIKGRAYFVNGQKVHETGFASDPEFPITSSLVEEMLGEKIIPVKLVSKGMMLPSNTVSVGEAETDEDIVEWVKYHTGSILLAGGASFFNALLAVNYQQKKETKEQTIAVSSPVLLVSGTTYQKNVERINSYSPLVSYMPEAIFSNTASADNYEKWTDQIIRLLEKEKKAIIAIGNKSKEADSHVLREQLSTVVKMVIEKIKISEVWIEGGSTAYSIIDELGWKSFTPTEEVQQGIVRMKVNGIKDVHLTIKPGSYEWPAQWNFRY